MSWFRLLRLLFQNLVLFITKLFNLLIIFMIDYPTVCKACGANNIITIEGTTPLTTMDCDNHKCEKCGKVGMKF